MVEVMESVMNSEGDARTDAIEKLVVRLVSHLETGARLGDSRQAIALARSAFRATEAVRILDSVHEDALKAASRVMPGWPVILSPMNGMTGDFLNAQADKLDIGASLPQKRTGYKAPTGSTDGQRFAPITHAFIIRMLNALMMAREPDMQVLNNCAPEPITWMTRAVALPKMPPRTKPITEQWFEVAWEALLWAYDGKPWEVEPLSKLADSRTRVKKDSPQGGLKQMLKRAWNARFSE